VICVLVSNCQTSCGRSRTPFSPKSWCPCCWGGPAVVRPPSTERGTTWENIRRDVFDKRKKRVSSRYTNPDTSACHSFAVRKPSRPLRCHQEVRTVRYPAPRAVSYLGFFTGGPTEARVENSPSEWPAKAASGWTKPYEHTSSKAA